jgi:hypothetical protein
VPKRSTDTEMPHLSTTHTAMDRPSTVPSGASRVPQVALVAVLGSLLLATTPAAAHTIDVRRAAAGVRAAAATLVQVDRASCWRPVVDGRRLRQRGMCMAWCVHTAPAACAVLCEVRMARHPSRRLAVTQTFEPWCRWPPDVSGESQTAARLVAIDVHFGQTGLCEPGNGVARLRSPQPHEPGR